MITVHAKQNAFSFAGGYKFSEDDVRSFEEQLELRIAPRIEGAEFDNVVVHVVVTDEIQPKSFMVTDVTIDPGHPARSGLDPDEVASLTNYIEHIAESVSDAAWEACW